MTQRPISSGDRGLAGRLALSRLATRASMVFERGWPLVLPLLVVVSLFFSLSWLGLFPRLPDAARIGLLVLFALAAIAALYPLRFFRIPSAAEVDSCKWLTEPELAVYTQEYGRTGFQGALQAYRVLSDPDLNAELRLFSGRTIDVPSLFIGGKSDWGTYSAPGALDLMTTKATTRMRDLELIDGAGHWIQQEQPTRLSELLLTFANDVSKLHQ